MLRLTLSTRNVPVQPDVCVLVRLKGSRQLSRRHLNEPDLSIDLDTQDLAFEYAELMAEGQGADRRVVGNRPHRGRAGRIDRSP